MTARQRIREAANYAPPMKVGRKETWLWVALFVIAIGGAFLAGYYRLPELLR